MTPTPLNHGAIYPEAFTIGASPAAGDYLNDPSIRKLAEFFHAKGLPALKDEDRREYWYEDWLAYQAKHQLYARLLGTRQYSSLGSELDLLRLTRFIEVFGYFSPGHGYSFQVSFLGLFSILMGSNPALKKEAVAALEAGELLAFGVSEKAHGSDLLGNEFSLRKNGDGVFVANGAKYYIGNANAASIISILSRVDDERSAGHARRAPMALFVLRPRQAKGFGNSRKIRTLGVRAGFVGDFTVTNQEIPQSDFIAHGRDAWNAVLGTVTLGKFFLGFASIGICEHAYDEAADHLRKRILYGKPVIELPHIRSTVTQAYVRLTAMKLYAYRALDYVQAASESDRRYLLFNAVQKAKVSTEGVKVMALLSECIGAKGFESDTYFEMALRDVQLIPGLESSMHINLGQTSQFIGQYFGGGADPVEPKSLVAGQISSRENPYLMEAQTGGINSILFADFLKSYQPLMSIPNVRRFSRQAIAFGRIAQSEAIEQAMRGNLEIAMALGHCMALIAYGQLIAENAVILNVPPQMISVIFELLVGDLSALAMPMTSLPGVNRVLLRRLVEIPHSVREERDFLWYEMIQTVNPD